MTARREGAYEAAVALQAVRRDVLEALRRDIILFGFAVVDERGRRVHPPDAARRPGGGAEPPLPAIIRGPR